MVEHALVDLPRPKRVDPVIPWEQIWAALDKHRFYDLRGEGHDSGCPPSVMTPLDPDLVSVEIRQENSVRRFSYSVPVYASCGGTTRFLSVIEILHESFEKVPPIPR